MEVTRLTEKDNQQKAVIEEYAKTQGLKLPSTSASTAQAICNHPNDRAKEIKTKEESEDEDLFAADDYEILDENGADEVIKAN